MIQLLLFIAGVLAAAYLVFGLALFVMQPKLLYRPTRDLEGTPADLNLDYEDVAFPSPDGVMLTGWYVPAPEARFTVLLCHGNGGNVSHRLDSIPLFQSLRLNCLLFDYRGYGLSEGRPTEAGIYRDARAAFDWLTQERQVPAERIVLLGRSLGGSIAAHLAAEIRPAGLVVESAFTSYVELGARFYPYMPVRWFARFRYDTLAYVQKASCPIMIVHSCDDELIPFDFGTRLFAAANEPKRFLEISGGHNDGFLVAGDVYEDAWRDWLRFLAECEPSDAVHRAS